MRKSVHDLTSSNQENTWPSLRPVEAKIERLLESGAGDFMNCQRFRFESTAPTSIRGFFLTASYRIVVRYKHKTDPTRLTPPEPSGNDEGSAPCEAPQAVGWPWRRWSFSRYLPDR